MPKQAHGQFLGVFDSIFSSIQNDIGSSLNAINQITQQMQKLYQTTVGRWRPSIRPAALSRTRSTAIAAR